MASFLHPIYFAPLLCAWALFRLCTAVSVRDAVYGTACAYAAQHITFCATSVLFGEPAASTGLGLRLLPLWAVDLSVLGVLWLLLNLIIRGLGTIYQNPALYSLGLLYDMLCCILILWLQREQRVEVDWKAQAETERRPPPGTGPGGP